MKKVNFLFFALLLSGCIETLNIDSIEVSIDSTLIHLVDSLIDIEPCDLPDSIFTSFPAPEEGLTHRFISSEGVSVSGNSVGQWDDLIGGEHLTPFSSNPSLLTNEINGNPAIQMDAGEVLKNDTLFISQPSTQIIVFKLEDEPLEGQGNRIYYGSTASGPYNNLYYNNIARVYAGSAPAGKNFSSNIWQFQTVEFNGASSNNYLNGVLVNADINTNTQDKLGLGLGGSTNGTSVANVSYAEVLIYDRVLTTDQKDSLNSYILEKYGLVSAPTSGTFTFTNTLNSSDYAAKYAYDLNAGEDLPILIVCHGVGGTENSFTNQTIERFASYGFFACSINLGSQIPGGAGGAEAHSVIDAVNYIRSNFTGIVSTSKASLVGYSGGGGVALLSAARYPDFFSVVADYFGPSDYGFDGSTSWYFTNTQWQGQLDNQVGSPRANYLNEYQARNARSTVGKNYVGDLYIFQDPDDALVNVVQAQILEDSLIVDNFSNYFYGEEDYYQHGYPNDNSVLIRSEYNWVNPAIQAAPLQMGTTGYVRVADHIETSLFSINLNQYAFDAVIDVSYDTDTKTYVCTPVTDNVPIEVRIIQGVDTVTQSISTETIIIL